MCIIQRFEEYAYRDVIRHSDYFPLKSSLQSLLCGPWFRGFHPPKASEDGCRNHMIIDNCSHVNVEMEQYNCLQ